MTPDNSLVLLRDYSQLVSLSKINKDQAYSLVWQLISSKQATNAPHSINNWITAYNLWHNNIVVPIYKSSEIFLSPDHKLTDLSRLLSLSKVNKEHIIRTLGYLNKLDNDMNVFDLLPLEILNSIFIRLERKIIKFIHHVSNNARKLNLSELLDLRRIRTFPRLDSERFWYMIPEGIITIKDNYPTEDDMDIMLRYLESTDQDLVYGDLITFKNEWNCIFDGRKIKNLDYDINEYGSLPKEFHVIENNVPIKYWNKMLDNNIVWFNHRLIRNQCISNIQYGFIIDDTYGIFTDFEYNNKNYRMIIDYSESHCEYIDHVNFEILFERVKEEIIDTFRKLLLIDRDIIFNAGVDDFHFAGDDFLYINLLENLHNVKSFGY